MNTNTLDREKYKQVICPLKTEDDKADCLRHLTLSDKHVLLCRNTYSSEHINKIIEESDYVILHYAETIENIVGFALLKILKNNVLDILLVCTIQNEERLGNMIAYSVYSFAISKKCKKIYTAPRTAELRKTFIKYGFEHLWGVQDIDEVLYKKINLQTYTRVPKTLKIHSKTRRRHRKQRFW
jgi:hypothetical protein